MITSWIDQIIDCNNELNKPKNIAYQRGVVKGIIAKENFVGEDGCIIEMPDDMINHIASLINKVELHRDATVCKSVAESGSRAKAVVESRNAQNVRQ